jgi:hypothetical protein
MPKIYDLLDTRDSFSLPILRMLPQVVEKLPAEAQNVVDRSIHFVLAPSAAVECAALDAIAAAIPRFTSEDKLLPMIHQMWAPSLRIVNISADCSNPAARRVIVIVTAALAAARSFVRSRIRDMLPTLDRLVDGNLVKLNENPSHTQAEAMMQTILELVWRSLDNECVFDCLELEVFKLLLKCLEEGVLQGIRAKAVKCLGRLYQSSQAFVWALVMEAAQAYPADDLKPSQYLPTLPRVLKGFFARLLQSAR